MPLNLKNRSFCIFGLPDSGKSTLTNFLLSQYGSQAFVYDTLHEYPEQPFDSYQPKNRGNIAELENIIKLIRPRYKMIVIDEANRFCKSKPNPLPQIIADLNDWRAHYGLTIGFIARRPVQLNQDLTEMAHFLFIFRLRGKNDIEYLNSIAIGLGDTVYELDPYYFVVVDPGRNYQIYSPVPPNFKTNKELK